MFVVFHSDAVEPNRMYELSVYEDSIAMGKSHVYVYGRLYPMNIPNGGKGAEVLVGLRLDEVDKIKRVVANNDIPRAETNYR